MLPPSFRYFLRNHYQRRPLLTVGCTPGVYALSGEGFRELHIFFAPRSRRPSRPTRPPDEFNIGFECLFLLLRQHQGHLVDSTALSVRFDPDDQREIVGDYHRCVAEMAGRFAAFVAKYMGDGVLVGYPQANGDDPARAVQVGLAVVDAVRALSLSHRIEIQTNWTRIPHIPSMITVATSPATTAPPTMNRSANALVTPCAIMTPPAPTARWARTKNAPSQ